MVKHMTLRTIASSLTIAIQREFIERLSYQGKTGIIPGLVYMFDCPYHTRKSKQRFVACSLTRYEEKVELK